MARSSVPDALWSVEATAAREGAALHALSELQRQQRAVHRDVQAELAAAGFEVGGPGWLGVGGNGWEWVGMGGNGWVGEGARCTLRTVVGRGSWVVGWKSDALLDVWSMHGSIPVERVLSGLALTCAAVPR